MPHIARCLLKEFNTSPKGCDTPPLVLSFTHAHLCDTPFCNISRDNCAIPHKNKHDRVLRYYRYKFRKIRAPTKIKSALPPTKPKSPPPKKNEEFYRHGFFLQKERIFPGVHKIGAPISGPRIADKNFTDTRIFLTSIARYDKYRYWASKALFYCSCLGWVGGGAWCKVFGTSFELLGQGFPGGPFLTL